MLAGDFSKNTESALIGTHDDDELPMKPFNLYDILGVLAPGGVVVVGLTVLFPQCSTVLASRDISLGGFGVIVLSSYIVGNLIASVGNLLELVLFKIAGGSATAKIRTGVSGCLSKSERQELEEKLKALRMLNAEEKIETTTAECWNGITRQMHSFLDGRSRTGRVEMFNAQYGMNRGIAAGLLVLLLLVLFSLGWVDGWRIALILAVCAALSIFRMLRFSRYYAGELVRQFLHAPDQQSKTEKSQAEE